MVENYFKPSRSNYYKQHLSRFLNGLTFMFLLNHLSIPIQAQDDALPQSNQKKIAITSKILNEQRSLWIYTPVNYQSSDEKYPVLYLLDPDQNFAYITELERFYPTDIASPS